MRPRLGSPLMPVTYDRYPGTSGSTHGDRNDTSPAASAMGRATMSEPAATVVVRSLTAHRRYFSSPTLVTTS